MNKATPTRYRSALWALGGCATLAVIAWPAAGQPGAGSAAGGEGRVTNLVPAVHQAAGATDTAIVHALNRMGFGPRPGQVAEVRDQGLNNWIAAQLAPQTIDDSAVEAKLRALPSLGLSTHQLLVAYDSDVANARMKRETRKAQRAAAAPETVAAVTAPGTAPAGAIVTGAGAAAPVDAVAAAAPAAQQRKLRAPTRHMEAVIAEGEAEGFHNGIANQIVGEMQTAKLTRAIESKRQLQEVLADFWGNHFNLDVHKAQVKTLCLADERDTIRPYVLGKFRDMLEASAKSAAMLVYLDNARSTQPMPVVPRRARRGAVAQAGALAADTPVATAVPPRTRGGLNENYARELMELHTLGVDGGYTQHDVIEVARCFTGWSFDGNSGAFVFRPRQHDDGAKQVLGVAIAPGGGMRDGEMVLDMLAHSPHTAHHLAFQLCQRLVADEPPAALVDRAARAYLAGDGDLLAMTRAIVTSPEFMAPANIGNKIKSPFEFVVSAARATGAQVIVPDAGRPRGRLVLIADGLSSTGRGARRRPARSSLPRELAELGEPMYACEPPTGYPEDSRGWVSTGALVARLNFALNFAGDSFTDVRVEPPTVMANGDDAAAVVHEVAHQLLGTNLSATTEATIRKQFAPDTPPDLKKLTALVLGSPEFQRR